MRILPIAALLALSACASGAAERPPPPPPVPAAPWEMDGSTPPRAAYLAVLDSVGAHLRADNAVAAVDPLQVPGSIRDAELEARGLRRVPRPDACRRPVVSLVFVRREESGEYLLHVLERIQPVKLARNRAYAVACASGECKVTRAWPVEIDQHLMAC